ncbi:MAG: tetratricopeptide repeat protein [Planctomycetota bacterium]|nr:tetratricopeptide repeat protein [Planctomycetota bacterium]MDA1180088.1 tetratricopeptide repeat protein [Planctomycetota bacterium]
MASRERPWSRPVRFCRPEATGRNPYLVELAMRCEDLGSPMDARTACFTPVSVRYLAPYLLTIMVGCQWSAAGYNADGVKLYQQGNSHAAYQRFQQALQSDPRNSDGYYNIAAAYHRASLSPRNEKGLEYAEDLYHRCLDLSPDHTECYRGLSSLLVQSGRTDSAFRLLEGWAQRSPQSSDARIELARMNEELGKVDQAERHLVAALDVDTRNPRAWAALGRLRERRGEYAQALSNYRQAYQLNSYQSGVNDRIASLQRELFTGNQTDYSFGTRIASPQPPNLPR